MSYRGLLVVCAAAMLVSSAAFACKGNTVLFEDDFTVADPAWPHDDMSIGEGGARLTPDREEYLVVLYSAREFGNVDICVDVVLPPGGDEDSAGGVVFWADSEDAFYWYQIAGNGSVEVTRLRAGRWLTPVTSRTVRGIDTRPGSRTRCE
jgi:hypothetical protein